MSLPDRIEARWRAVDWLVAGYAGFTGLLILFTAARIPQWPYLLLFRGGLLLAVLAFPARGAGWEKPKPGETRGRLIVRRSAAFARYGYPLILVFFFFEEVAWTVNALWPRSPYWFEPYLYRWDRALFGGSPALALAEWNQSRPLAEVMHAFYFSYYVIVIGGVTVAWFVGRRGGRPRPARAYHIVLTAVILAYLLSFAHYPFLPARGPWENEALMAPLPDFRGYVFVPLIDRIIEEGAVSGGCFPSSHVAASWAVALSLWRFRRRTALAFTFLAVGVSFSCVYTRYHHAVDVPAGFALGVMGALAAPLLVGANRAA